jgi:hypothetical protein
VRGISVSEEHAASIFNVEISMVRVQLEYKARLKIKWSLKCIVEREETEHSSGQ